MEEKILSTTLNAAKMLCRTELSEQYKPVLLVANGKGTQLYSRHSAWGRIWSAIHWICGTGDTALAKVIRLTASNLHSLSQERQNYYKMVEAEGVLGDFWKTRSITSMNSSIINHLKISYEFHPQASHIKNLIKAIRWSEQQIKNTEEFSWNESSIRAFEVGAHGRSHTHSPFNTQSYVEKTLIGRG